MISILGLTGEELCVVSADRSWNIAAIKRLVQAELQITPAEQRLLLDEDEFEDIQILAECLPEGATELLLICRSAREKRWIQLMGKSPGCLSVASQAVRADRGIILHAVRGDGEALQYASEALRSDRRVVAAAVKQNVNSLRYASQDIREDAEFIKRIMETSPQAFAFTTNVALGLEMLAADPTSFTRASPELLQSREFVGAALRHDWTAFKLADGELRNDPGLALAATAQSPDALQYAARLAQDREFVLRLLQGCSGLALAHVAPVLQGDREIVLAAVTTNGEALQFAAPLLRDDRDVVLVAVGQAGSALAFASAALQGDVRVAIAAVSQDANALKYVGGSALDACHMISAFKAVDVTLRGQISKRALGRVFEILGCPRLSGGKPLDKLLAACGQCGTEHIDYRVLVEFLA